MALSASESTAGTPGFRLGDETVGTGEAMHRLAVELYPICRSITGNGVRETLRRLQAHLPLTVHEVPTGTRVFDSLRTAPLTDGQRSALRSHEQELEQSLTQARRFRFLAGLNQFVARRDNPNSRPRLHAHRRMPSGEQRAEIVGAQTMRPRQ